jgi:hypothetical protein
MGRLVHDLSVYYLRFAAEIYVERFSVSMKYIISLADYQKLIHI